MRIPSNATILLLFLLFVFLKADGQDWQWVRQHGGSGNDNGSAVCCDNFGNTYLLSGQSLLKYNSLGTLIWTCSYPSVVTPLYATFLGSKIYVLCDSGNGTIVKPIDVFGQLYSSFLIAFATGKMITADPTGNLVIVLESPSYIYKIDTTGSFVWGTTNPMKHNSIVVDDSGFVYSTGYFSGSVTFNSSTSLSAMGGSDIAVAKLHATNGGYVWAKQAGGNYPFVNNSRDAGNGICLGHNGSVFVTGSFVDSAYFDSALIISPFPQGNEMFIAKYDVNGNFIWAKYGGGWSDQEGRCVTIDMEGNILVGGSFVPEMYLPTTQINGWGNYDAFVVKFDTTGNFVSSIVAGGPAWNEYMFGLSVDQFGNVYAAGSFSDTSYFGIDTLASAGLYDAFIARIDFTTGIEPVNEESFFRVYPNPTFENSELIFEFGTQSYARSMRIYDAAGNNVHSREFEESRYVFRTAGLKPGVYFYSINESGKLTSGEFVIQ